MQVISCPCIFICKCLACPGPACSPFPLQQWVMLSQGLLELGKGGTRASPRQSPLMGLYLVWRGLGICKPGFVASSLLVPIVSSCLVLPWFPFVGCGMSPLLLGVTPWFCLRSGGCRPLCQIQPSLQNGSGSPQEDLGGGRGAVGQGGAAQGGFSGALCIANGMGTSCGWRNRDQARLGWTPAAHLPPSACSPARAALLGPCMGL